MKLKKGIEQVYDLFRSERMLELDYQKTLLYMERWALRLLCYVWEYGDQLKQWQKDSTMDDYQCQNRPPGLNDIISQRGDMRSL